MRRLVVKLALATAAAGVTAAVVFDDRAVLPATPVVSQATATGLATARVPLVERHHAPLSEAASTSVRDLPDGPTAASPVPGEKR
jgi:hypothetical protein